jgi:negative modulator of initiation of replication
MSSTRTIEIEEDIHRYLCSQTKEFGETPSSILRRLLRLPKAASREEELEQPPPIGNGASESTSDREEDIVVGEEERQSPGQDEDETPQPVAPGSELALFLTTRAFTGHHQALGRFLALLTWLYQRHSNEFEIATRVRGRRRIYFAENPDDIRRSGSSTMPQPIPDTPWYVTTNTSTRLKSVILTKILSRLGYSKCDITLVAPALAARR